MTTRRASVYLLLLLFALIATSVPSADGRQRNGGPRVGDQNPAAADPAAADGRQRNGGPRVGNQNREAADPAAPRPQRGKKNRPAPVAEPVINSTPIRNSVEDLSTPSVPRDWPVVELERSGGEWRVASNAQRACGILAAGSFAQLRDAALAFERCGPVVLKPITPGEYTERAIEMHGGSMAIVGPVDANGIPTITLTPSGNSTPAFALGGTDPKAVYFVVNFKIGPPDRLLDPKSTVPTTCGPKTATGPHYQAGGSSIGFGKAGRVNAINLKMRNSCTNGISSGEIEEWLSRRYGQIWVYDSEVYGQANSDTEHNIYVHDLNVFAFIRSISSDTGGAHLVKVDGEKVIILDSALVRNARPGYGNPGNTSALLNVTRTGDIRVARTLFKFNPIGNKAGGAIVQTVARTSALGGFGLKTPPVADIENLPGFLRHMTWESGERTAMHWTGRVDADVSAGATTLLVSRVNLDGEAGARTTLPTSMAYTVRVVLDDMTIQEFTSTPSAAGLSTATFPVPGSGLTKAATRNNYVAIKVASRNWDSPVLNPRYANKNSPDYWWTTIKNDKGQLDLTHQERFNTHYFEDDFFVYDNAEGTGDLFWPERRGTHWYWSQASDNPELPLPPFNRPQGPTKDWPDHPGYAEWKEPLQGPGYPYRGRNPSGVVSATNLGSVTDFIWAWPMFFADVGIVSLNKPLTRQVFNVPGTPNLPQMIGFTPDVRYVNSAGVLTQVTSANPEPAQAKAVLVGAQAKGARTLTVNSASGCSNGQKIMVELPLMVGAQRSMEISTIDQPISGTSIHIADGLSREAAAGANVVCFTKAAARPSTWIGPNDYATR